MTGAGDGNRTNPNEPNKGVTTRFSVQLESNGVKSCEGQVGPDDYWKAEYLHTEATCPISAVDQDLSAITGNPPRENRQ
jgi:hypothetical protein